MRLYSPTGYCVNVFMEDHCRVDSEHCVVSKPGSVLMELKLRSKKEKSITCGCFPQSYGPYEVCEKAL